MYAGGMNGSIMPSAGHYSDMQTLMHNMETLSGWLQQNRDDWNDIQNGLAKVERLQVRFSTRRSYWRRCDIASKSSCNNHEIHRRHSIDKVQCQMVTPHNNVRLSLLHLPRRQSH